MCIGALMIVLDRTMVIVALPYMGTDLGTAQAAQLLSIYLLASGGFLRLVGRLGDLLGHRRIFVTGVAVFTLCSLGCSMTASWQLLLGLRTVQALGTAAMTVMASDPARRNCFLRAFMTHSLPSWRRIPGRTCHPR